MLVTASLSPVPATRWQVILTCAGVLSLDWDWNRGSEIATGEVAHRGLVDERHHGALRTSLEHRLDSFE
jgi:hypothetical protein